MGTADIDGKRLMAISEELRQMAEAMLPPPEPSTPGAPIDPAYVRSVIRLRRLRDHFFNRKDLFADPAWDMLLDLFAARLEGQTVPVSSLCIASAVAPTIALRWIDSLSKQGMFVRTADPSDGRRVRVQLSEGAADLMEQYIRAVRSDRAMLG
jgi:hypothetical protein